MHAELYIQVPRCTGAVELCLVPGRVSQRIGDHDRNTVIEGPEHSASRLIQVAFFRLIGTRGKFWICVIERESAPRKLIIAWLFSMAVSVKYWPSEGEGGSALVRHTPSGYTN